MNNVAVFQNEQFGQVRSIIVNGEPWFVAKDVALALGYVKPENAVAQHVEKEDKTSTLFQGSGSNYKSKTVIINESGLYALIFGSKLDKAKAFKHWVTSEVLPAIRQTGVYNAREDWREKRAENSRMRAETARINANTRQAKLLMKLANNPQNEQLQKLSDVFAKIGALSAEAMAVISSLTNGQETIKNLLTAACVAPKKNGFTTVNLSFHQRRMRANGRFWKNA